MPIALDTSETVDVWLNSDAHKPEAERPVFVFHHLSYKQFRQVETLREEADKVADADDHEARELRVQAVKLGLVGWRNMGFGYDATDDLSFLTRWEIFELAWGYPKKLEMTEIEKKAPSSRLPSNSESSTASQPSPNPSDSQTVPAPSAPGT